MADKQIGALTDGGDVQAGDAAHVVRGGNSRKVDLDIGASAGAASTSAAGIVEKATDSEVYSAASDKFFAADHIETASAHVTLTDGASPSFDWDAGINREWEMGANRALPNPSNGQPGTWRTITVMSDGATARTLTFDTYYGGELPTLDDITDTKWYELIIRCVTTTHFLVSHRDASPP